MENATKALLIAAAVLVAIVLIALGIVLINNAADTSKQADETGKIISNATDEAIRKFQKIYISKEEFNDFINDFKTKYKSSGEFINRIQNDQNSKIRNQIEIIGYIYDGKKSEFFSEKVVADAHKKSGNLMDSGEYWKNEGLPYLLEHNKLIKLSNSINIDSIKLELTNFYNNKTGNSKTVEEFSGLKLPTSGYWFFIFDDDEYIEKAYCIYSIEY